MIGPAEAKNRKSDPPIAIPIKMQPSVNSQKSVEASRRTPSEARLKDAGFDSVSLIVVFIPSDCRLYLRRAKIQEIDTAANNDVIQPLR